MNEVQKGVESLFLTTPAREVRKCRKRKIEATDLTAACGENLAPPVKRKALTSKRDVKAFYTKKTLGRVAKTNLETIYEDPDTDRGKSEIMGKAKIKRSLNFEREFRTVTKQKKELRQKKIKRLGLGKSRGKKMTKEEFEDKLSIPFSVCA